MTFLLCVYVTIDIYVKELVLFKIEYIAGDLFKKGITAALTKEFFKFVIPSMIAFAFSGVYSIVDGWFVGNYLNETGLAAINVAYPITAFILATGTAIGMGGAIFISISEGKQEFEKQKEYLGMTFLLLFIFGIIEMILIYFTYSEILGFFGASGELLTYGEEYVKWIVLGTLFQMIGTGLVPIVRNYDGATVAMVSMIIGFLVNVVLDWLFIAVFGLGLPGAALATVLGQGCAIIPSLAFIIKKKKLFGYIKLPREFKTVREILAVAVSPFGLTYASSVILIIVNKNAIAYGGAAAAACYAVISYVTYIIQMLIQGVGDGSQPLISRYYGADDMKAVKKLRNMAFMTSEILSIVSAAICILGSRMIAEFFGMGKDGLGDVAVAMPYFAIGFLFIAIERVTTSIFYAMDENKYAYILIYGELILMGILATFVLSPIMGVTGVWMSVTVAQAVLAVLSVIILKRAMK